MNQTWIVFALILALFSGAFTASAQEDGCEAPEINAVATVGMIADIVRNVGGSCVAVEQMMGAGVDPHLYRATEGDVLTLLEADVVFYGGLHLEARLADVFEAMSETYATVAVSEAIPSEYLLLAPGFDTADPHVWMDAELWMFATQAVRDELIALDGVRQAYYEANTEAYLDELRTLDEYIHEQVQRVPEEQRVLVTAHDAFQYFGHAYGIDVFAPQGITTTAEAGVNDIRRTIDLITERQIPAVFVESSVPPDVVEAIIEGVRARGQDVTIGGSLFSDAMGADGTPEGTYVGMIRHNVDTIVGSLLGDTAE